MKSRKRLQSPEREGSGDQAPLCVCVWGGDLLWEDTTNLRHCGRAGAGGIHLLVYTLSACCSQELEGEGAEPQGRKQHGEERAGGSDTIGLISMLNKGDGGGHYNGSMDRERLPPSLKTRV